MVTMTRKTRAAGFLHAGHCEAFRSNDKSVGQIERFRTKVYFVFPARFFLFFFFFPKSSLPNNIALSDILHPGKWE